MSNLLKAGKQALTTAVVATTVLWSMGLAAIVPASAATLVAGDLIKASGAAVYYYNSDGKRYVYPNEKTFKTWYADFSKVKVITDSELAAISIGGNVTYRAGTRLVKITTDPKVYAVEPGGHLRWVASEAIMKDLYGTNWNKMIDDVSDAFFTNYVSGANLTASIPAAGSLIKTASSSDIYYVDGTTGKRKIADFNAFTANNFRSEFIQTVSDAIANGLANGTSITGMETSIAMFMGVGGSTGNPVPTGTGLSVSVDTSAVPSSTIISGTTTTGSQAQINLAKFNFMAGSDGDVAVKTLKLKRIGVANDSDLNNAYLYMDGKRIAEVQSISSGIITFTSSTALFQVTKGTTAAIWVKADLAAAVSAGKTLGVSINASTDVVAGTGVNVTGTFPMIANTMSIASVTDLGMLTVATISPSATTTADPQDNYEAWKFSLAANNQNVKVSYIAVTNLGSTSQSDLANFKLYDGSTQLGSTVAMMDANRMVAFDLSAAPLLLNSGVTKQLSVRVDIKSGSTRTMLFSIQKSSDIIAMDQQYNISLFPIPSGGTAGTWTVVQAAGTTTINSGTLTTGKSTGSPTTQIVKSGTNVLVAEWDLKAAGEDVKISTLTFTPTITSTHTILNGRLYYDGVQAGTTTSTITGGTNFAYTLGNSLIVKADGASHKLSFRADITGTATTNETVLITMAAATGNAQGMASLSSVNVPGAATTVAANTVTITVGAITPSRVGITAATYVENTNNVSLGQWSLQAGSAEDVDVTSITFNDSNSAGTVRGATGLGAAFSNLTLYKAGAAVSQVISNPSATIGTAAVFNLSPAVRVSSTSPITFELKGTAKSGADALWTDTNAAGITAVSGTGVNTTSGVSYTAAGTTSTVGPAITVSTSGTLSVAIDTSGAASSQFYTVSLADQEFARLRLTATNEDIKLTKLVLTGLNATSNLSSIKLTGTGLASDPSTTVDSSGLATFNFASGSELMVTKDTSKVITVKGTTGPIGALVPSNKSIVMFGTADAAGSSSGTVVQENFGGTQGTNYYVAATNAYSGDVGDIVYFTATGDAGTSTAPGYYMVTTDDDAVNLSTGDLDLNGEATDTSFNAGDTVVKLSKVESVLGNGNAGVAYNIGDLIYVYDSDDNEAGFRIVTTGVASGAAVSGLVFSPAGSVTISAAGDHVTKLTNTNSLAGNTMQFEEVEPIMTRSSFTATTSPSSNQDVVKFDVKADGQRDLSFSGFTFEKTGSNSPEQYVTKLSLWNGSTKLAEVANTTVAATADGSAGNANNDFILVTGATTAANEVSVTAAQAASLQIGDRVTVVPNGTAAATTTATITGKAGTIGATTVSTLTLTFDQSVVIPADATTISIRNFRVHFDANQINTGDTALATQTVTQGSTMTLTVQADTQAVRTGVSSGTVTFGVNIPGVAGPNALGASGTDQTNVGGLTWTYTKFSSASGATAHTGSTADLYPVSGGTISY